MRLDRLLRTIILSALLVLCSINLHGQQAKYVFYFIGDGMGINQVNAAQMYKAAINGRRGADSLSFTNFPVRSFVTTYSASDDVTDSAAAGTALACGDKTANKHVGVDSSGKVRYTSVAEYAKMHGAKVGITTTVSINHATPATFYAHQKLRTMDNEIALDAIAADFDLYAGSGIRQRKPAKGADKSTIYQKFNDAGYTVAIGKKEFEAKRTKAEKMVFINSKTDTLGCLIPALDRRGDELTLPYITRGAIDFLSRDAKKGFFLMVEGGTIDWVLHSNDAAAAFAEIFEFSDAITLARNFYLQHPDSTLIVVTADHETGGITLGEEDKLMHLNLLSNQRSSQTNITQKISKLRKAPGVVSWESIRELLTKELGFWDTVQLTQAETHILEDCYKKNFADTDILATKAMYLYDDPMAVCAVDILNTKAKIAWASGAHTAGVVPVYAIGVGAEKFSGVRDNTDIPKIIKEIAGY